MSAVLRIYGNDLDVDGCKGWVPANRLERVWRAGEKDARGRVSSTNGVCVLLSDEGDIALMLDESRNALLEIENEVRRLSEDGASCEVDFAMWVEAEGARALKLDSRTMRVFACIGVDVIISAYPCGAEPNA